MPPKRNNAEKKQQAAVQDVEEAQNGSGGHGLGLGLAGLGPGLPASKPQWLENVLDGLTNKFSILLESKLSSLDMKITKHLSSIEANVAVLKSGITKIYTKSKNILCCSAYLHPSSEINKFNDHLREIMSKIANKNKLEFIMGDFNINLLNYENPLNVHLDNF